MTQMIKEVELTPKDLEPGKNDKEYDPNVEEPKVNKGGRPKKSFKECGPQTKKARLQPTLNDIRKKAKEENISTPEILGILGEMDANQEIDRPRAKIFKAIANKKDPFAHQKMSVEQAVTLKVQCAPFEILKL